MSWILNATDWTRQATSPFYDGNFPSSLRPSANTVVSMSLPLTTAGRLGFFIDYSERETVGTHTFYVCRTHGSTGAVSVDYSTGGDVHNSVTGTLNWADGDMSIQSFTVEVTSAQLNTHQVTNGLGEHRMWAVLSNPTNGGVLHFGTEHTRAYGVIDNDVLASDANAVFYDSAAVTNGTGTQASPYNSVYDAIANIGSKRYLYGKGTTIPDGTDTYLLTNVINVPATRTNENDRLYIRNWSGSEWNITSSASNTEAGFFTEGNESYHTYKGIDFSGLDCSSANTQVFGVHYRYGNCSSINMEACSSTNINGQTGNNGLFLPWGVDGFKMWNCSSDGVRQNGEFLPISNTAMLLTYLGKNGSVQRCTAKNSYAGVFHKRTFLGDVSTSVRFCEISGNIAIGVLYGQSGSADSGHSFTVSQCNIFNSISDGAIKHKASFPDNLLGEQHWWCNNVFDSCGSGDVSAIHSNKAFSAQIFNNIFYECRQVWGNTSDNSNLKILDIEYADYQCAFGTTSPVQDYVYRGVGYSTAAALNTAFPAFEGNTIEVNPLFTDRLNNDFTLQAVSPALYSGVSGTQQGAYLGDFYTIGAN